VAVASYNYVIISPVRDEERYLEGTINAVLQQTVKPLRWVIVDDGSRDRSPLILQRYAKEYPWITVLRIERSGHRQLGITEIKAFSAGYQVIENTPFDYIVKLDCDLELPQDYFERVLSRFESDEELGIASGIYLEEQDQKWTPITMPEYHAAGASKVIRAECFRRIGGFTHYRGWDTIDEIRAQMRGWKTCHFADIAFRHLRPEGSAAGSLDTNRMHGQIYYLTGGSSLFLLFKVIDRCWNGRPFILGGLMMLIGFFRPLISRTPRAVTDEEASFYSSMLNRRMAEKMIRLLTWAT
jgi:glycosyltransferase involved in cell wall biosynthesis